MESSEGTSKYAKGTLEKIWSEPTIDAGNIGWRDN